MDDVLKSEMSRFVDKSLLQISSRKFSCTVKSKMTIAWFQSSQYAAGQISAKEFFKYDWYIYFE